MTIKETAGKILLYFYQLQRTAPSSMQYRQLGFIDKKDGKMGLTSDKRWLTGNLLDINPSTSDIFNAFGFLRDKGFVRFNERTTAGAIIYVGMQITAAGIDVVEGIESDDEGRQAFAATFNIRTGNATDVESLISENLGHLLEE